MCMRFILPFILLLSYVISSQAQGCEWAENGRSGAANNPATGVKVTKDGSGNIYVVGIYDSVFTFLGTKITNLYPGGTGVAICKLTSDGVLTWMKKVDSNLFNAEGITVQGTDVYVYGHYQNNITIGAVNFSGMGINGIILKFDSTGALVWGRTANSTSNSYISDLVFVNSTSFLFAGRFRQNISIDGTMLTGSNGSNNYAVYGRMTSAGALEWVKTSGEAGNLVQPTTLAVEPGGKFFMGGVYRQGLTFGAITTPAPGSTIATVPFLAKFSATGDAEWIKSSTVPVGSGALVSAVTDIRVLNNGQVMLTGGFYDKVTFLGLTSSAGHSAFALRVQGANGNLAGSHLVESNVPGNRYDFVEQDGSNNIWLGGAASGLLTVRNNGTVESQGYNTKGIDILLAYYSNNGTYVGIDLIGGTGDDKLTGAVLDNSARLIATGSFTGTLPIAGKNLTSSHTTTSDLLLTRICSFSETTDTDDQIRTDISWNMYPNPAHDQLTVELPLDWADSSYRIWSIDGRLQGQGSIQGGNQSFAVGYLQSGHYVFQIVSKKGVLASRFEVIK